MRSLLFALVGLWALAACAPRPMIEIQPDALTVGTKVPVFVGTTRRETAKAIYRHKRSEELSFSRVDISIPPAHQAGRVETHRTRAQAEKHFVASKVELYDGAAGFRGDLRRALAARPRGDRQVLIYVHGFNNTFADGVFRAAQAKHDFKIPGIMVHYSWPSHGNALGYAYDRDSALYARDGLVDLIDAVSGLGAEEITLIGHSMGGQLTMEALRQMALVKPGQVHRRIDSVVLIAPDIDVELFRAQARVIGQLPETFAIFVSKRDRALSLSAQITGEDNRLGNTDSIEQVSDLDVVMFDVSAFRSRDPLNHLTAISSPALIQLFSNADAVQAAFQGDRAGQAGLFNSTVLTIQNATAIILSPVTAIAQ